MWHKAIWKGHPMRLELTRVGLLVELANHYTTKGASETRTMLCLGLCSLNTPNNSTLVISFSLEHGSSLHESQRPTDLKPKLSFFLSFLSLRQETETCVSLILANNTYAVISTLVSWNLPHRSTTSTSTCTNNSLSLVLAKYVSTTRRIVRVSVV